MTGRKNNPIRRTAAVTAMMLLLSACSGAASGSSAAPSTVDFESTKAEETTRDSYQTSAAETSVSAKETSGTETAKSSGEESQGKKEYVACITDKVNIRTYPDTSGSIAAQANTGDVFVLTDRLDTGWLEIEYEGKTCYVYGEYFEETEPETTEEEITTEEETPAEETAEEETSEEETSAEEETEDELTSEGAEETKEKETSKESTASSKSTKASSEESSEKASSKETSGAAASKTDKSDSETAGDDTSESGASEKETSGSEASDSKKETSQAAGSETEKDGTSEAGESESEEEQTDASQEESSPEESLTEEETAYDLSQHAGTGILYQGEGPLVAIDAGHQLHGDSDTEPNGPGSSVMKARVTSGTQGVASGVPEYELNLTVALKLRDALLAEGYSVLMIRETNEVSISNAERAELANAYGAQIFLRLHCNGSEDSSVSGVMTMAPSLENEYCAGIASASQWLSTLIANDISLETGFINQGVLLSDTMTGINWCQMPVSIIEMGFMSNAQEDLAMQDSSVQDEIVKGIVEAVNSYFGQ